MSISKLGEFKMIEKLKRQSPPTSKVKVGIGDDTAVVPLDKKRYQLLTTDMMVEEVHFRKSDAPRAIGRKALGCCLSDIAAMGGRPQYALVSLGMPPRTQWKKVRDMYLGMHHLARKFNVHIVGGDSVKADQLTINVAAAGEVKAKQLVLRSGAKAGDVIFVTGKLGDSLKSGHHLKFTPRLKEAQFLVRKYTPNAMIDISDGLAADLDHIIRDSGLGAEIEADAIPRRAKATLNAALYGGEDFELLFTVPKKTAEKLAKDKKFRFIRIGTVTKRRGKIHLIGKSGKTKELKVKGYKHF